MLFWLPVGVVLGVFLSVKYNLMIKNAILAAWAWISKQVSPA